MKADDMTRCLMSCWDGLLALGMLLAMETQLRGEGALLGPGEFLITLWMGPLLLFEIARFRSQMPRPFWDLLRFWSVFALAQSLGVIATIAMAQLNDWSLSLHDIVAYVLLVLITGLLAISPNSIQRLYRIQWLLSLFGGLLCLLQLSNAFGLYSVGGIDPWYWDRMRGWTANPNQLALFGLLLGILSVSLVERSANVPAAFLAGICAALALVTGWMAKSNAYLMVVVAAAILLALLKAARWLMRAEGRGLPAFALSAIPLMLAALALVVLSPALEQGTEELGSIKGAVVRDSAKDNEETAALRFSLWAQALDRGAEAGMLGLGPGPHLAIPAVLLSGRRSSNEPANIVHPTVQIAPNFEAHNTLCELFVQSGILGVGAFLWIGGLAVARTWRSQMDGLTTLLLAAIMFGSFHVIFRHPLVWFIITLALVSQPAQPLAKRRQRQSGFGPAPAFGPAQIAAG